MHHWIFYVIMNLNQVTLPSLNLERSILYYKNLGLTLIVESLPRYARFECPEGNSTISLHLVDQLPIGPGVIIYFEKDNLDQYIGELQNKGIEIIELPEDKPWLWRESRLKDPDNNEIIIFCAGENRKNPPWRIESKERV